MSRLSVKDYLDRFVRWRNASNPAITVATIAVRERTARRALCLKKADPLVYQGLTLRCVGSRRWRLEHPGEAA